jgi:hypothetical protein
MPLHFRENRYAGVNAHLQSHLQSPGGDWASFHAAYITYITEALSNSLPEGYFALIEKSLQLYQVETSTGDERRSSSRADIGIVRESGLRSTFPQSMTAASGIALVLPVLDTISDDEAPDAVIIVRMDKGQRHLVTRIEVLSPANKPPQSHAAQYLDKRNGTLRAGINLVELDFMHEQCPPVSAIPCYRNQAHESAPFLILVSDVRGTLALGTTTIHRLGINQPIPSMRVPLANEDIIDVDFGSAYYRTFAINPFFGMRLVDYAELPPRFDTYTSEDQARIRAVMSHIAQTATD